MLCTDIWANPPKVGIPILKEENRTQNCWIVFFVFDLRSWCTLSFSNLSTCTCASLKAGGSWYWPWRCSGFVWHLGKPFFGFKSTLKVERLNRSHPSILQVSSAWRERDICRAIAGCSVQGSLQERSNI